MRAALPHQVGQIVHVVPPQPLGGDLRLLALVVPAAQDLLLPPLVAGSRREDTPHKVITPAGMGKGVQGVLPVHPEGIAGDEHRAGGAQGDIAAPAAYRAAAHGGGGVVPRSRAHGHVRPQAQPGGGLRQERPHGLPALIQPGELRLRHAADVQHLPAPAFVFHIQQQHPRGVGVVGAVDAGEAVIDVVLGQHDLANAPEKLRLVFPHPQQLGGGEPGEGDVGGVPAQLLPPYDLVEVLHLFLGPPVVPENGGTDHRVVFIQGHQPVHLTARADAPDLSGVQTLQ